MNRDQGKITKKSDGFQVRFERELNYSIDAVWDAITNPEKLKIWFTDFEMELTEGADITIKFRDEAATKTFGKIIKVEPPRRFEYTWEGELAVWELEPIGDHRCRLVLTYSKLSSEYAINAPAGFHSLLDRLEDMLGGNDKFYPFGTEENDPAHLRIQEAYGRIAYDDFPELKRYKPVVIERTYNAPIDRVWSAITDKEKMKEWYFDLEDFKPQVGFKFQFEGGTEEKCYLHLCEVTEVVPGKKLQYSWKYDGYAGNSFVTFELFDLEGQTKLKLTHTGLGTFPESNPDLARENFVGGWEDIIGRSLKQYLENL
ncbi:SRPBCC domain-containing protein [Fulvivirga ulvae]|uniref:SRPBCC domain-containing protein n=1 Tax=Fulvivirga ulvae TaxID=2904245 RepID=UPI001F465DE9|nr:SRPBCC domain-containing protein [Fulvivirga ulvae]UII34703.1 SRPBCC domain-containing protein [Fulvivirga ulvae]